jgi:hypothetical protein
MIYQLVPVLSCMLSMSGSRLGTSHYSISSSYFLLASLSRSQSPEQHIGSYMAMQFSMRNSLRLYFTNNHFLTVTTILSYTIVQPDAMQYYCVGVYSDVNAGRYASMSHYLTLSVVTPVLVTPSLHIMLLSC